MTSHHAGLTSKMVDKYSVRGSSTGFFEPEEDIDDFTFLNSGRQGAEGYRQSNDEYMRRQMLIEETRRIQERTLESSKRSLGIVHESEQLGVATAEELLRQREQLENCDRKLDETNQALRISQKHITSIKSWFGGFKGIFSKSGEPSLPPPRTDEKKPTVVSSQLSRAVEEAKSNPQFQTREQHPALRIRGYEDPDQDYDDNEETTSQIDPKHVDAQLDMNLDDLSAGLSRLKGLAVGLGHEVDAQNEMLDRLNDKADSTDIRVQRQNTQMKKILGK